MNKLIKKISYFIPNRKIKNYIRRIFFPLLFITISNHKALIGPKTNKQPFKIKRFVFHKETTGNRDIEAYLQHYQPKPGDIIINAGAYHGYFALYLSKIIGSSGRVICFEPDKNNLRVLNKNLQANKINNVIIIPKGLWSKKDTIQFATMGSSSRISSKLSTGISINVCCLDEELQHRSIPKVDFISMDIEGAEIEALHGATQTIKNNPQIKLAIASYHIVNEEPTAKTLEQIFHQDLHLKAHTSYPAHPTTYASY